MDAVGPIVFAHQFLRRFEFVDGQGNVVNKCPTLAGSCSKSCFASMKAFKTFTGNHGCCSTKLLRMPTICMIGKRPVFL